MNTITLIKTKAVSGAYVAGLGTDRSARYTVKGAEHITIKPFHGGKWMARDENSGKCLCVVRTLSDIRKELA